MKDFISFYKDILSKKHFWLPLLFFALVGYGFSTINRTISIDDLYVESLDATYYLSGRWGMLIWIKLTGLIHVSPLVNRFLSIVLYAIASILLCFVLFMIGRKKNIMPYSIAASAFITYPLINEIWEYTCVNYMVAGNLCLVTLSAIVGRCDLSYRKKYFYASLLLILPMSSYESAIFYYITLICAIIFYEQWTCSKHIFSLKTFIKQIIVYVVPLLVAFVVRFLVSFCINSIYNLEYDGGGATGTIWIRESFGYVLKNMIGFIIFDYGIMGLVYLPISVFLISLMLFAVCILSKKTDEIYSAWNNCYSFSFCPVYNTGL